MINIPLVVKAEHKSKITLGGRVYPFNVYYPLANTYDELEFRAVDSTRKIIEEFPKNRSIAQHLNSRDFYFYTTEDQKDNNHIVRIFVAQTIVNLENCSCGICMEKYIRDLKINPHNRFTGTFSDVTSMELNSKYF